MRSLSFTILPKGIQELNYGSSGKMYLEIRVNFVNVLEKHAYFLLNRIAVAQSLDTN